MKLSEANQPYVNLLWANAQMAAGFLLLYFAGAVLKNMHLLLLAILFACLCFVIELLLGVLAAVRGQLLPAALYGLLSLVLFYADSWLLEGME